MERLAEQDSNRSSIGEVGKHCERMKKMSVKNELRIIFFAFLLMLIIGGIYATADYAFAESGERNVTLELSGVYGGSLKIFDKNGKEMEKVSSKKLPKEKRKVEINEFNYTTTEVSQWKLKLTPGEYTFKIYDEYDNYGTVLNSETDFKVTESGDNHHHFVVYNINIYDNDNPVADIKCKTKVTDADKNEIKVTDYEFESEFEENGEKVKAKEIRKNFILKYEKGCKYDISVTHEDPGYVWKESQCRIGSVGWEYTILDGYIMPSFTKKQFKLSIVSEGLLWEPPYADLYCTNRSISYRILYPKELENFQVCEVNTAAYQRFKPLKELQEKYNIINWDEEDHDKTDSYSEMNFKAMPSRAPLIFTGGGEYRDKKTGKLKESKYIKTLLYAEHSSNTSAKRVTYKTSFIKHGEEVPRQSDLSYNRYGNGAENALLTTLKDEGQYQPLAIGKNIDFFTFRIGQGVDDEVTNTIIEPDKLYRLFGDSVSVSGQKGALGREWNRIKPEKSGATIVAIGYKDAFYSGTHFPVISEETEGATEDTATMYESGSYFPEVDPDRIGIAIFDVEGSGEKIKPNISRMTSDGEKPLRKYDRVHFVKSMEYPDGTKKEISKSTEFTLHPTCEDGSEVKVYYHKPIKTMDDFNNKDFFTVPKEGEEPGSDWIRAEKNGKYSKVKLEQGNNVIMMKTAKHTRYFVIAAKGINVKSVNLSRKGKSFAKGDKVKVHIEGLVLPVPKLSAIYNPGFPDTTYLTADINGKATEGTHTQYGILWRNWFVDKYPEKDSFTIADSKNLDIKKIRIHSGRFGDGLDGHCDIGPESGRPPNLNADEYKDPDNALFGVFEDVSVPILHLEYPKTSVIRFVNAKKGAFRRIKIDGEVLDKDAYTISEETGKLANSGVQDTSTGYFDLTLNDEYLKNLDAGKHKVEVKTSEGNADGTFSVEIGANAGDNADKGKVERKNPVKSVLDRMIKPAVTKLAKVTKLKVKVAKKKAVVSWKRLSGVSGYEVYRRTGRKGRYVKIASVKNAKIKSSRIRTAKGAKSVGTVRYIDRKAGKGKTKIKGRKYYYKVRAFKKMNGKRVYGAYFAN